MAAQKVAFVKPCFELLRKKSSYPLISEGRRICQFNLLTLPAAGGVLLSVFPKMDRAVGQTVEGLAGGGDQIFQYAGLGEDRGGFEAHREDWCLLL